MKWLSILVLTISISVFSKNVHILLKSMEILLFYQGIIIINNAYIHNCSFKKNFNITFSNNAVWSNYTFHPKRDNWLESQLAQLAKNAKILA